MLLTFCDIVALTWQSIDASGQLGHADSSVQSRPAFEVPCLLTELHHSMVLMQFFAADDSSLDSWRCRHRLRPSILHYAESSFLFSCTRVHSCNVFVELLVLLLVVSSTACRSALLLVEGVRGRCLQTMGCLSFCVILRRVSWVHCLPSWSGMLMC